MYAKKSLGQNFLKSDKAVREIIQAGELSKNDIVLEIGPGMGVLTEKLLASGAKVIAIEKDDRLVIPLSVQFEKEIKTGQFVLVHGDVLDFVGKDKMLPSLEKLLNKKDYKLIANIPYYITGEIIERFHTISNQPKTIVLLVQKEVAERIIAKPLSNKAKKDHIKGNQGKESILSVAVKIYGEPKLVSIVPRGAFAPAPNVDSAILAIKNIKHFGNPKQEKEFFDILHNAFAHKRKYMLSNIKSLPKKVWDRVDQILKNHNYTDKVRAEDISISIWQEISKK